MFIRRKIKTRKGQTYEQHQLLKSIRTPSGPRQEVILNLGTLDLPKDQWKILANTIEEKLNNQGVISFSSTEDVEKLADHFAQMIISKEINQQQNKENGILADMDEEEADEEFRQEKPVYETVDINSTKTTESRSIGAEYIVLDQMKRYGFDKVLADIGFTPRQIDYAKHLVVGRAVHPSSERELVRWINENSGIKELINSDERVYDNALHRVAILLWENKKVIEKALKQKAQDLFSLDERIILYDLTNTYFEGKKDGSQIAQFGRSKEKRSDCKLATLALIVDSEGFPKESHILEGNISEPKTLKNILKDIKNLGKSKEKKTLVIDAGIASDENIALIKKEGMSYVAISRKQSYKSSLWNKSEEKKVLLNDKKTELSLKLAVVAENNEEEAFLLCHSPLKEIKEKQITEKRIEKFAAELTKINDGLKKPRSQKRLSKIMERIGRLKERYHVGNCFDIEVKEQNSIVEEIIFKQNLKGKAKLENLGKYVIRTNRLDLKAEEISNIHRSLTVIESSFRSMKSDLGLRPNYHKNEEATVSHIFITVLAYHMVCPILKRLDVAKLNYTWKTIRKAFESHDRVITVYNTNDEHCIYVRNTTIPNLSQKAIYNGLRIRHDPLKNITLKRHNLSTQSNVVPKS